MPFGISAPPAATPNPRIWRWEPMVHFHMTYHILADGTILCDSDHQLLQNVRLLGYLGIMYQEKCDLYDCGVWRYIPKVHPFIHEGQVYDSSLPYNTSSGPFPDRYPITADLWTCPDSPPDRQIDFIRGAGGSAFTQGPIVAAFAGGFLPLFDGAPERRRENITDAVDLVGSRKTYPTFVGGQVNTYRDASPALGDGKPPILVPLVRGVGYRKYFQPASQEGGSVYTLEYDGCRYLYMDFIGEKDTCLRHLIPSGSQAGLLEASDSIHWEIDSDAVTAQGEKGYAVFKITLPDLKN